MSMLRSRCLWIGPARGRNERNGVAAAEYELRSLGSIPAPRAVLGSGVFYAHQVRTFPGPPPRRMKLGATILSFCHPSRAFDAKRHAIAACYSALRKVREGWTPAFPRL